MSKRLDVLTVGEAPRAERYRVGIDIGGTFTDFVLFDGECGQLHLHKCLTTPKDPAVGALEGLEELLRGARLDFGDIGHLVHGTTLVTNAIIERRGAALGLLTTRGFRDTLEMGSEQRYDIYDLFLRFPEPLAPRPWRREIDERISRDGEIVVPLDVAGVERQVAELVGQGVEALAVCFLHAYKNPRHERLAREIIARGFPSLAVSLSSEVVPELREYERGTTTTANAYVQPLMDRYVARLEEALAERGFRGRFHLMQSAGGMASPATARAFPIRLLESGPAGGGLATAFFGGQAGHRDVISFDMGGTTAKACLIQGGQPDIAPMMEAARVHRFKRGSGLPIKAPVIDMIEIGAGGGSIARVDPLGLLKVGPRSAGADPGPACYGLGGKEPTVTDANLVLGYLDARFFLGGRMRLDGDAAEAALAAVAEPLGLSAPDAAWGVYTIVCENMAAAARVHIVEKGRDPRRYAMVGFGGAGPAHAARVARILGVREVIVPPASGAASALGFLVAPISFELVQSLPGVLDELDLGAVNTLLADLEARGRTLLAEAGVTAEEVTVRRRAEMRLLGQVHDITVPLPDEPLAPDALDAIKAAFAHEYARLYTHVYTGTVIQAISWRVQCSGPAPSIGVRRPEDAAAGRVALKGSRRTYFGDAGGWVDTPVYDRYALRPGQAISGPAIVEEREATTVVPPGDRLEVDAQENLRLRIAPVSGLPRGGLAERSLSRAVADLEADPVGLEIMWSRLINLVEECWLTVWRTAFSLIIGEAQDFACEILDARGNSLAHSPRAMPVFNLTLPRAVRAMLEKFPVETLRPGDILTTNDPWMCAGHLFDVAIVTPVFRDGRVVALIGTIGHVADIGGTKDSLSAREIYEEGFQIPPMKLYRAGEANQDLLALLAENVRKPEQVLGDIHAMISANASGARRLLDFMEEYGLRDLEALATVIQDRSEAAMRAAIRGLPGGVYEGEIWNDGMGAPQRYRVRVTVRGDEIDVDFPEAPPQAARGGSNCTYGYTAAHTVYPLKCMLSPGVPSNAGAYRPLHVTAPEGSTLNCTRPMAVNTRVRTGWYIAPNLFLALCQAAPRAVQAFTGLPTSVTFYGVGPDGRVFNDHLFQGGGQGGSAHGDGKSALLWPTSAGNTSVELFETRTPVLVLEKNFVPDTGGPGRHRGGLGQIVRVRKLYDDGRPVLAGLHPDGVLTRTAGLFGGREGGPVRGVTRNGAGKIVADHGIGGLVTLAGPDEILEVQLAGGAGYGDPLDRAVDDVRRDLQDGRVSADGATRDYGWVADASGRLDEAATLEMRARRRVALLGSPC
jgi:N-methylhydantoinase A/oxoprolinase/acetone carboxylase beta subunit/N-methylhydantoinase B/oxoprolinase/acetone carboxylase alpha subunit